MATLSRGCDVYTFQDAVSGFVYLLTAVPAVSAALLICLVGGVGSWLYRILTHKG